MTTRAAARTAWYLRVRADDVGDGVVLVGDRGRARLTADLLDDAQILNEDRGLTTVTGTWKGQRLTVVAFGMGAPIATICLHELAALGATRFVRAGTMMAFGATELGDTIVSTRALIHEGTSSTYGVTAPASAADPDMLARAIDSLGRRERIRVGTTASCDGFYTQMSDILSGPDGAIALRTEWAAADVIGVDMETSALYSAAQALGVAALSVCLASVDLESNEMMDLPARQVGERNLMLAAFGLLEEENP